MFAWLCRLYEWNFSLHRLRWFLKLYKIKFYTWFILCYTFVFLPFYHTTVKNSSTVESPCGVQLSFLLILPTVITVRSSCGKVMFSLACVKNSVHGGGDVQSPKQTAPCPKRPLQWVVCILLECIIVLFGDVAFTVCERTLTIIYLIFRAGLGAAASPRDSSRYCLHWIYTTVGLASLAPVTGNKTEV